MSFARLRSGEDFGEDFYVKRDESYEKPGGIGIRKNFQTLLLTEF